MTAPTITEIELRELDPDGSRLPRRDSSPEESDDQTVVDVPTTVYDTEGGTRSATRRPIVVRIHTDVGVTGQYVTKSTPAHAIEQIVQVGHLLVGENPFDRERLWTEIRFELRKSDCMGLGAIDIALWDLAGRIQDVPIHQLLGTYRRRIPAYVATAHGADHNGLETPSEYVEFGKTCREHGFEGYKLHTWELGEGGYDVTRDAELAAAVGTALGDDMDLMLDLSGKYATVGDALTVGQVCDAHDYFWIEDPFGIQSISQTGHRRLRSLIDTPILHLEHVRGLELHADAIVSDATDFVRVNPEYDGGITGAMKISRAAESLGADVEFNFPGPARRQCLAAIRNANYYEITDVSPVDHDPQPPLYEGSYVDGLSSVDDDGTVPVPDGPGLGVTYDDAYLESTTVRIYRIS